MVVTTDTLDLMDDEPSPIPTHIIEIPDQPGVIPNQFYAGNLYNNDAAFGLDFFEPLTMAAAFVPSEAGLSYTTPIPNSIHSSHVHPQVDTPLQTSPLNHGMVSHMDPTPPPNPLANLTKEPAWMKKKRTLNYFRDTSKLGDLSNVIGHWYELEGLLGFQEMVSIHEWFGLQYAHDAQTPPGFPTTKRPAVVRAFHKNAHNYRKDYNIDVHTLGYQIMGWWSEICPPGGVPSVRFGGPTGIYTLVVLLSWWCTLLKARAGKEHADCLHTLTDVDRVLLAAINEIKSHPTTPSLLSPPSPLPPTQPRKRANSGEMTSERQKRSARG